MSENSHPLPDPDLEPQRINVEQYHCHAPEKFELLDGYLFDGPEVAESRLKLLQLLFVNVGLLEVVKLLPERQWREALARAYGPDK